MHTLNDLIDEQIDAIQGEFSYRDLQARDQHKLSAAYIIENEEIIFDIFADVHETSLAHHFAAIAISIENCDVFAMANDLRNAIIMSKDIESLVDTEIELRVRSYQRYGRMEAAEVMVGSFRESA